MAVENWQMPAIGAGAAFLGSIPQMVEARRLGKERERLMKEGAPGMSPIEQEQMAAARSRAASALAPGYAQEIENINQQQADILGATRRAGISGSNVLNTLSRLNQQGQAARRNLAIRGAQAQRAAQGDLQNISMSADARRQGRVQNWEAKMAAMDAARRQYNAQAGMSPVQGALAFMPTEGLKFTKNQKPDLTIPSEGTPMSFGENLEFQSQYNRPSATDNVPRNLPYAPSGLKPQLTGLEREPSMMAAPNTGETEKEWLISNPLKNTTFGRGGVNMTPAANPTLGSPTTPTGLERTPSMLAAPQYGQTMTDPRRNTTMGSGAAPSSEKPPISMYEGKPYPGPTTYYKQYTQTAPDGTRYIFEPNGNVKIVKPNGSMMEGGYKLNSRQEPVFFDFENTIQ